MQITVEVKFEQPRRAVRRTPGVGTTGPGKTQRVQIEGADERVEEADGVFRPDVIFQPFGKQQCLGTIQTSAMIHA